MARALALVAPALAFLLACGGRPLPEAAPPPRALTTTPSIVVVTIDTLRADHVHAYGYHRETSPNLDAIAAEGVLFERAFATMSTTLPSHLSLFTGVYPHQHGVTENGRRARLDTEGGLRSAAQLLREDGWATAAFVSAAPLKRVIGIDAGFDVFEEPAAYMRKGSDTTDRAIAWLEGASTGPREPFFLWVHLWHPHEPNRPPAELAARFQNDPGLERVIDERDIDPDRLAERFDTPALRRFLYSRSGRREHPSTIDREAVREMLNRYDADVAAADREVGRLIAALARRELLDRSIVVVAGDHGQSLGQHDWLPHGRLTNDNLQVPLVMRFPPGSVVSPRRVSRIVSMVDVLPTVLARVESAATRRFLAQAEGQDALGAAPARGWAFAQRSTTRRARQRPGEEYALVGERFKLVRRGAERELYDLAADPGERVDVAARFAGPAAELEATLAEVLRRPAARSDDASAAADIPAEQLEELRSLGYVDE